MKKIILASASPRRSELLKQMGIVFDVFASDVDEIIDITKSPDDMVKILSCSKAYDVAGRISRKALVIGADTVVVKDEILGKPENYEDAVRMLLKLQGRWHFVYTGITVIDTYGDLFHVSDFEKTRVKMRKLTLGEIKAYAATNEPYDKAGAYGIQGLGAMLVEKIDGCYFNVVGLPIKKLTGLLEKFNYSLVEILKFTKEEWEDN